MTDTVKAPVAIIKPANILTIAVRIEGTAPLVQARFSEKTRTLLENKMKEGSTARGKKQRDARDFEADMRAACHEMSSGGYGIPAGAFRQGMISACRLVGFKMTLAKLSVFVEADGFDVVDGLPLVALDVGEPECNVMHVRNATGVVDIRARPMWREWGALVQIKYDADQFTASDVVNLLERVGTQVGIGEGRPDSRMSSGLGWGTFRLVR
jgi:hypothetical protein